MDPNNVDEIIAGLMRQEESGEPLDREAVCREHPEHAATLRKFFADRDTVGRLLSPLSAPASGRPLPTSMRDFGDYELQEEVARGGMGVVYRGRQKSLGRTVAVKMIRCGRLASEEDIQRFQTEARAAAGLRHANIVSVYEVGVCQGQHYFSMEYVEGQNLAELIRDSPLSARRAARYVRDTAAAVEYAHQKGTLHRDLKPSNVLVDASDQVRITDFGLAAPVEGNSELTRTGQILGTPSYIAPEQAQAERERVGPASDIYSLGVILYELLTGRPPFRAETAVETIRQVVEVEPVPLRRLNPTVPRDLETICLKCLEKEPSLRYSSAAEFVDDCTRFLRSMPVRARPVSRLARGWRWCRRNLLVAALSAAVAALLIGVAVVSSIGFFATQAALEVARKQAGLIEQNLYHSEMNRAAGAAGDPNGLAIVSQLLENWRPQNTLVDRRGWEWYYLDSLLHQDVATIQAHEGPVSSVAWWPDGSRLATASGSIVKVWGSDGKLIQTLGGHKDHINSMDWSKDGTLLATASFDATVRIWDADRCELVKALPHQGRVYAASWSHDQCQLATASLQKPDASGQTSLITIWSTSDWQEERTFNASAHIDFLRWSPVRSQIATGSKSRRGCAGIWDPQSGTRTAAIQAVGCVAWNHAGSLLAVGDYATMSVWNVAQQEPIKQFDANGIGCACWSPKQSRLAFTASEKVLRLSDPIVETEPLELRGHLSRVNAVCWHPSGHRIATCDRSGAVKIWKTSNRPRLTTGASAVSWNPDGSQYASRVGASVVVVDVATSKVVRRLEGHAGPVFTVSWSPDGARIASASEDGELRVWNAQTGEFLSAVTTLVPDLRYGAPLPAVVDWSPDSRRLAFPQADHAIGIVDANTLKAIRVLKGHTGTLRTLAWSSDGSRIVSGGEDRMLRIWNTATGRPEKVRHTRVVLNALCWSPDGSRIVGATPMNDIYIWDSLSALPQLRLGGHTTYVHTVSWSPDGRRIASADESGSIRIWDADTGQQTLTLKHPYAVPMVAWNPNGKGLASVGFFGEASVRIWDATVERPEGPYW